MAEITHNIEILLDRLYNLKGEDNILLKELSNKIADTESEIENTEENRTNSEINKVNSEGTLELFLTQKQTFEEAFQGLDNETFSALREIDVNLEIGSLLTAIEERSPEYCDKLHAEINKYDSEMNEAETHILVLNEELNSLNDKKVKLENDCEQLVSLLEQSLSPNEIERDSLTAHYVKRIISPFELFNEDELNKITKLIMFPDEGLYQYDQTYEERLRNGLVGLTEEIVEEPVAVEEITIEKEPEVVIEQPKVEETPAAPVVEEPAVEEKIVVEEPPVAEETEVKEEVQEPVAEEVEHHAVEEAQEIYGNDEDKTMVIDLSSLNRQEEPEEVSEEPAVEEPPVAEETAEDIVEIVPTPVITEEITIEKTEEEPVTEETPTEENVIEITTEEPTPVEEVVVEKTKEEIMEEYFNEIGLDKAKFNEEDLEEIYELLNKVEERHITENYEILRSISLEEEAYTIHNGHMYLADTELNKKLTLLRAKGVKELKIQELLKDNNSGLRDSFEIIEEKIVSIQNLNQRIDNENIDLLRYNIAQYEKNLNLLASNGYELDEKEIRNHNLLLFESTNIPTNIEILKEYLISIVRNNGKYALSVFWKNPAELLTDIDDLIEADLENIISNNPEILSTKSSELISRVKYCEEKGEPIYEGNNQTDFCKHISSYYEFYKKYGVSNALPELIPSTEVNAKLPTLIGNEDLVLILEKEYSNIENVISIQILPEMKEEYNRISRLIEDKYNAKVVGKHTYKFNEIYVSKNKLERNLIIILNALASDPNIINKIEKEIVLTAALYNTHQDEETIREIVNSYSNVTEIGN